MEKKIKVESIPETKASKKTNFEKLDRSKMRKDKKIKREFGHIKQNNSRDKSFSMWINDWFKL